MKQGILILFVFVMLSCTNEKGNTPEELTPDSSMITEVKNKPIEEPVELSAINTSSVDSLKLETFSTYPDDFVGCGCSFFLTEQDKQTQNYIYLDAGDIAMIKLNGVVHTLNYKGQSDGVTTYENDLVVLKRRTTSSVESAEKEETSDVEGVLSVTKDSQKLELKFIGFCGC